MCIAWNSECCDIFVSYRVIQEVLAVSLVKSDYNQAIEEEESIFASM